MHLQYVAQTDVCTGITGVDGQCALTARLSLFKLALDVPQCAQIDMGFAVVGFQGDGFFKVRLRLFGLIQEHVYQAEIVEVACIGRQQFKGVLGWAHGFFVALLCLINRPQSFPGETICWKALNQSLGCCLRLLIALVVVQVDQCFKFMRFSRIRRENCGGLLTGLWRANVNGDRGQIITPALPHGA